MYNNSVRSMVLQFLAFYLIRSLVRQGTTSNNVANRLKWSGYHDVCGNIRKTCRSIY